MWCVIIPVYNNHSTIRDVITDVMKYTSDIIVVNDGSCDGTREILQSMLVTLVDYSSNRGKGYALKQGFMKAKEEGYDFAVTIDADGQHFADDISLFIKAHDENPESLIVGCRNLNKEGMPGKNTFANKFSNFWFYVQTGIRLSDTQTGFRMYPLNMLNSNFWWLTSRYEAELELLVYSAWQGIDIQSVNIQVNYFPEGGRISHFRPIYDFVRISVLNTILCLLTIFYAIPLKILRLK